jgi:hypothetical protein
MPGENNPHAAPAEGSETQRTVARSYYDVSQSTISRVAWRMVRSSPVVGSLKKPQSERE